MNGKIIVVTHKDYEMPKDSIYFPVCVGVRIPALSDKFQPDNVGENISEKNNTYCELTAIYWAWKNFPQNIDYVGVAHYRRHFSTVKHAEAIDKALTGKQLEELFEKYDDDTIFATTSRSYYESIENHYIHSLKEYKEIHKKDIARLKSAIHECAPAYDNAAKSVLGGRSAHMLNMFIMSRKNFNEYCAWLFPIIDSVVEKSKDREDQRRYAGALSEFCLDIWAQEKRKNIQELLLLETEKLSFFTRAVRYIKRKI